jgi:hypothetical protein
MFGPGAAAVAPYRRSRMFGKLRPRRPSAAMVVAYTAYMEDGATHTQGPTTRFCTARVQALRTPA